MTTQADLDCAMLRQCMQINLGLPTGMDLHPESTNLEEALGGNSLSKNLKGVLAKYPTGRTH